MQLEISLLKICSKPENSGKLIKFHWIYLGFSFKLALPQFLDFWFCEWRVQINFRLQARLHSSIFRFLALYGSIECASRQILIRQFVARDMDFRFPPIFRKCSIFSDFRKFSMFQIFENLMFEKKRFFSLNIFFSISSLEILENLKSGFFSSK